MVNKPDLGLVQVFYGNGKGKTTSALGTALRACGNGYNVHLIQFMKNGALSLEQQVPGEILSLQKFNNFSYKRFGLGSWFVKGKNEAEHKKNAGETLSYLKNVINEEKYDIIIADELLYAVQLGLIEENEIINLIKAKPKNKELILTGSHKPLEGIFALADLVTEVRKIKHPYDRGILARKGIEF